MPVWGDRAEMLKRAELGAPVPDRGPVEMTIQFSSEKAVSLPVRWSQRMRAAMILPPKYSSRCSSDQGYSVTVSVVKSTIITFPI